MIRESKAIRIPIYKGYLVIIVSDDIDYVNSKVDGFKHKDDSDLFAYHIYGNYKNKRGYQIVLNPRHASEITPGIIAHECLHAVLTICNHLDIKVTYKNSEASCYLLEWVFDQVNDFYNKSISK